MADIISESDIPTSVKSAMEASELALMIAGANARASRVAPCLAASDPAPTVDQLAEAKLILVGAVKRWSESGSGSLASQSAGPFAMSVDTRQRGGYNLWPSEITQLQDICKTSGSSGAFTIDTAPGTGGIHADVCALTFGALYCSCGADLTGSFPLWEEL